MVTQTHRVLLIDDDEELAAPLRNYFSRFGLELISATTPGDGLKRLETEAPELIILDVMLPEMDGFEVCRTIRKNSNIPILMLTARGEVMDRVVGLELGADDYLSKPFEPRELVARIHNILRRAQSIHDQGDRLSFEQLEIDTARHKVRVQGREIPLTTKEYQLLLLLAQSPQQHFSRDDILNHLRGVDAEIFSRAVDILVSRLRKKLLPTEYIQTIWGSGYTFIGKPQ